MTIGLLGALELEVRLFVNSMTVSSIEQHIKRTFYRGDLLGHDVVVTQSGVGKVRAAACTQFLIKHYGVDRIIFAGIAGALNPQFCVGDIVVANRALEWDFKAITVETAWYQADLALVDQAVGAAQRLGRKVWVGSVLTGDRPVHNLNHKQELLQAFNADCVEMEGGAVALVCFMNDIPFVLVRAISDFADERMVRDLVQSFEDFISLPAEVVLEMLKESH